jgi:hypothetical protein
LWFEKSCFIKVLLVEVGLKNRCLVKTVVEIEVEEKVV